MKYSPEQLMALALIEARKGVGLTAPNPPVGAVVVKGGKLTGKGHHRKAGGPHAEVNAIRDAGSACKGATLVVTLEPCSTIGRTPACTDAILEAGFSRVIVGCMDPNPAHAGRGLDLLRNAGVEVIGNVLEPECRDLIRAFAQVQLTGMPYVTLKLACTLDGRIADARGNSKWITGPESRARVQELRRECDAILVGTQTVIADDPSLLPRPRRGRKPLRIVPDRQGRIPLTRKVFSDGNPTLCLVGPDVSSTRKTALDKRGVEWIEVALARGQISWKRTLKLLADHGVQHLLCEGGGQLASALLKADAVQELHWVVAPKLLGEQGRPSVGPGWTLPYAPEYTVRSVERLGEDCWITVVRPSTT
jgi:diaminohydroxyphosphoribosylaminopyrimidine deaminase/5-amino-6-(5-phosphoribosylamino)uracil reductase